MRWNIGKRKGQQSPGVEPRIMACAASALPLSGTTTNPRNLLCILYYAGGTGCLSHTLQLPSMCHWTSIRGRPENSLHQEEEDLGELSKTVRSASIYHKLSEKGGVSLAQAVTNSGVCLYNGVCLYKGVCPYHKQWGVSLKGGVSLPQVVRCLQLEELP